MFGIARSQMILQSFSRVCHSPGAEKRMILIRTPPGAITFDFWRFVLGNGRSLC
jgi:hypothetical protein